MKVSRTSLVIATLAATVALAGCDHAPANVQTLQTSDCGVSWTVIKAGQRIPTTAANKCAWNTVLPDYPMQGDLEFKAQFDGNVLVTMKISYDYEIQDPMKFLGEAKFLGKMTSSVDGKADNLSGIEQAENSVIDKRIREVATAQTVKLNVVDFNPAKFEEQLQVLANVELAKRGIKLNDMTLVMIPEEQTRQAIDAATAMNVYASKGLTELGKQLAIARAGAGRIVIGNDKK